MSRKIFYSPNTFQSYGDPEIEGVDKFLKENALNDKAAITKFEERVASLFNVKYGIFVNSGSSANLLACLALDINEKDEVITPACTFPTTLSPLIFLRSNVVFCDVYERHYVPSVQQVLDLVTDKTTAVLIPDLVGDKFDFELLRTKLAEIGRTDIKFIEDACDTITTTVADVATVSFYASHIINAGGCGGMALTNDDDLADKMRRLRSSGAWDFSAPSFCAIFGYFNSLKIDEFRNKRHENLLHYYERLKNCDFYELPENAEASWLSMAIITKSHRFEIVQELESLGVQTRLVMAGNILRQPFYAKLFPQVNPENFPETEKIFRGGLLIGLHQGISSEDVDFICDKLIEFAERYK
ncbi:DegT/DnrJ/EryC1/StrS aminotransferase family protein [Tritrichomonas foetus]|uniref:DegT/DnrJ/EryC1/StrS aminotransferase family protein n=1 Tax=Tritrichomonas foetus TaxID=1144522 RepID=A0A1J4KSQ6_9EUKA|nr:DegT/DnrJ/EryC1/StrS aminotransferase family protein [Tritrichomonas foetus]|eukprot:OHT12694.1 DegT/DnrJ/EryC1/StrS aminotransferase family protein [Tritrichomonas foetus]